MGNEITETHSSPTKSSTKKRLSHSRTQVRFDPPDLLLEKCRQLSTLLRNAKHAIVSTGAGISTAASIPDYRGPNGVWTLANRGLPIQSCNPSESDPTLSHMALRELFRLSFVKHIVSQNCDGLHLRSGLPQTALSEIHGNMYVEYCLKCQKQFVRTFDVTSSTRFRRHKTGRSCDVCSQPLIDTIVHFGERGKISWPLNWSGALESSSKADLILCLGSSLQILKEYTFLWNPKAVLCIVNLQWTPKDRNARLKINARCDDVISLLMRELSIPIPSYCRSCDPVLDPSRRNCRADKLMSISLCGCLDEDALPLSVLKKRLKEEPNAKVAKLQKSLKTWDTMREQEHKVPGWWTQGILKRKKKNI